MNKTFGRKLRQGIGILLAAAVVFNMLPLGGLAVSASENSRTGICEHHTEHTADCGYAEAGECRHAHTKECYTAEGEPDCHHEHDEGCGYAKAHECTYVCEICSNKASGEDDVKDSDAEDADLSRCEGEKTENRSEENKEDAEQGDTGAQDAGTNLCAHHKEHMQDCGYSPASEDGEGSPCTYECRICPIEDMIAALTDEVTEDNAEKVRVQLDKILALYRELTAEEQEQIDLTRCYDLQAALDEANAPMTAATGDVVLSESIMSVTFTAGECGDNCQGHIITQGPATMTGYTYIIVESGTHNVTFSGLNISPNAKVGVMPGATMNLTLQGTNTIKGNDSGIYVPEGATLFIDGSGSLTVTAAASSDAAGIGGAYADPSDPDGSKPGDLNCGTVVINGGTITATGGSDGAGIGGAAGTSPPGNGGTVTINGGAVTATGGGDGLEGGAGIGGGTDNGKSGSGGTLTINGGNVTLTAGHSTAYGFGRGSGSNSNTGTLTLADAGCLTLTNGTTLDPKGTYSINGDPTPDMIVVPTDLIYTGKTHDLTGKIYIDDSKTGTAEYFGQTFKVSASADGWDYTISPAEVKEAGDYTVTFTKGGKSISTTFTVAECPHTGLVYKPQANNKHGGTCLNCGTVVSEEHTWVDGICSVCNLKAVAKVETSDGTIVYLGEGDFANAFDDRKHNNVTVTLLSDIQADSIEMGDTQASVHVLNTSTLDLAGHTITSSGTAIYVYPTGNLTIQDSSSGKTGQVVSTGGAAILTQTDMVSLIGGTYTGNPAIDGKNSSTNVSSVLANYGTQTTPHYAYFDVQGNPIALDENQKELTGTVTVKVCTHPGVKATPNNNSTHSLKCPYCGYTEAADPCSYGTEYKHDNIYHWLTCTVCGYENKEVHNWEFVYDQTGNVTENYWLCFDCRRTKGHLTLTITVPTGLTYGNTEGKKVTYTLSPEKTCDKVRWRFTSGGWPEFADGVLPANLPVGEHWFRVEGLMSDDTIVFSGAYYLTVSAAPLTGDMVTLAPASAVYSGAEQKPAITVKQGDNALAEGTDYDVTYSTNNFTNAGTVIVTITGKGNYKGTVEKTYTIKRAVLTADGTGIANGTYGAKLSELSVTGLTAISQETGAAVPGTWKLTGSTVPDVGDTGTYTATFTPAAGAENFEPLTAQVTLKIAKAAAPVPQTGTLYVQNNGESYRYDLTQLLPALDNGKSYGTVSYTLGENAVNISGGYYTDGAKITGTTLTLPIQKVENSNEGNIGTVSITITSRNYGDMTARINVMSVNKSPVTITGVSVAGREYNGEAVSCTGTPRAAESGGGTAAISREDYRYTWKKADGTVLSEAPKNAGSYLLIVSVDNDTYIGSRTISFVIDKAKITITANSMTVDKGGAKPALSYTISGLAKGDALTTEPTLNCTVDMNTAGRYPITVSGAGLPNTGNYHSEITYVPGTLTVTVRTPGGSGSSGGGNSGGSGNASDGDGSGSENNENNGSGNTAPKVTDKPSIGTDMNLGMETTPIKSGTGNTVRQGSGTGTRSSAAQETRPDTGIPFIKGEDGKIGWNVIRAEEEKAEEGTVINVDMNGTTVVPGDIFDSIKGRDITITFDIGSGILWSVDGRSIIADKADDIDFTVRTGGSAVPVEIVNNVTGEHYSIQLSLAHDGEFGFTAVLSVNLGKENAGYTASLYYYNQNAGELEFMCADEVTEDGTVSFAFTHASDYVIVIDRISEEPAPESAGDITEAPAEEEGNSGEAVVSPKEIGKAQKSSMPWLILAGIAVVILGATGILIWKRKKEEGNREAK
ncbi:MAG: LPXTG cell wall anchor domain-containing protein [Lachnospiraceae bacterium]|nr:LPXTG cell wall anchor domain-containing protein [Lachnospiraceae bacterium]